MFDVLFAGRRDVWGSVHGQCVKHPLSPSAWRDHLEGRISLGIYPLVENDGELWVHWGCSDIDVGYEAGWPLAVNLQRVMNALGISTAIEKTKGKGWHIWTFAAEWVPAATMRNAWLAAHQIAGIPPKEVNPKQSSLAGLKGYGNYVNVPYFAWGQGGKRCVYEADGTPLPAREFAARALAGRVPLSAYQAAAKLWVPERHPSVEVDGEYDGDLEPLVRRMGGKSFFIFRDGPLQGHDRSSRLFVLAQRLSQEGYTPREVLALVADADRRWGKYHERHDCDEQLRRLVTKAWRGSVGQEEPTSCNPTP